MCDPNNNNNCSYALSGMEKMSFSMKTKIPSSPLPTFPRPETMSKFVRVQIQSHPIQHRIHEMEKKIKNVKKYYKIRRQSFERNQSYK